ncbi:hypothetical protein AB0O22_32135 [Streptomyces sp. NPDC091204]|uniref:hypothetical protein n=1 Tax=Streptomyces sp. NPDC091204 TaxID=3155299 RepID=UPI00343A15BD
MSRTLSSGWCWVPCGSRAPLGPARCPLPAGSDPERLPRLLKAIDEGGANGTGLAGEWSESERIVLDGVARRQRRSSRSWPTSPGSAR